MCNGIRLRKTPCTLSAWEYMNEAKRRQREGTLEGPNAEPERSSLQISLEK